MTEDPEPIDFSWFWFIGKKMNLSFKETGRLTFRMFNRLYSHYKNNFDLEMRLRNANVTYAEAHRTAQKSEEWL